MTKAKVVYASLTGNTEEVAELLGDYLIEAGVDTKVLSVDDAHVSDFADVDATIVATYTYGDGDLPGEIVEFYDKLAGVNLDGKVYGVVGTGDTSYELFCKSVDDFEEQFEKTGAVKGAVSVKIENDADSDDKEKLEIFAKSIATTLNV
ncbi:MAG: flavodoxin [Candidatus Ancillula trichonymphae]|jgi:flavodoxin short chain|nr:flavodoxin [Candidatus Ancillula trichonymphae]